MSKVVDKLYFDFGNSRVKWSVDGVSQWGAASYDQLETTLSQLQLELKPKQHLVVSFVTSQERAQSYLEALASCFSVPIHLCLVLPEALGLRCGYRDPAKLGVDRWLAVLAVWQQYRCAALVVDLGTAATIDAIDQNGEHLGGYIVCGLRLATSSLLAGTDKISPAMDADCFIGSPAPLDLDGRPLKLGQSTQEAVELGALCSMTALIKDLFSRLRSCRPEAKLVITGGDEPLVGARVGFEYDSLQGLVFQGMAALDEAGLAIPANGSNDKEC